MNPSANICTRILLSLLVVLGLSICAHAVEPDEVLEDQVLEERARDLSAQLRCMVCQNQSIDDSDASLAKDLRVLVRKRLVAGDSDDQVMDFLVERYGEFVLLKPRLNTNNFLLWSLPVFVLIAGAGLLIVNGRSIRSSNNPEKLSKSELSALEKLLDEQKGPKS